MATARGEGTGCKDGDDSGVKPRRETIARLPSSTSIPQKKKMVVVKKKRAKHAKSIAVRKIASQKMRSGGGTGLPSQSTMRKYNHQGKHSSSNDDNEQGNAEPNGSDDGDDDDDDDDDLNGFADALPCDTLLVIQSLQQQPTQCLGIPLVGVENVNNQQSMMVYCVLHCQLVKSLDDGLVHSELQQLYQQGRLQKLTAATQSSTSGANQSERSALSSKIVVGSSSSLEVFLPTGDYNHAVEIAMQHHNSGPDNDGRCNAENRFAVVKWFLRHVPKWSGKRRINESHVIRALEKRPLKLSNTATCSASTLLHELQELKFLLPHHEPSSGMTTFQLWLPSWGRVVEAWNESQGKVLRYLKQSSLKERSCDWLRKHLSYSPIPADLLLQWMETQGQVRLVERPSGMFCRLQGR